MKKLLLLLGAVMALVMTGCSPFALVNSEVYNNADLAEYKTFRIVTPGDSVKLPPTMSMVTYYNIAAAIREQMYERGFTEDPSSPLLINLGLTIQREIATQPLSTLMPPYPPYAGPFYDGFGPWYMWPRSYYWPSAYYSNAQVITGIYKEGVLTMDFVNIPEKLPLYSASVATVVNPGEGTFRNLKDIAEAVETLFSKFPVPLLPQYQKR